MADRAFTHLQFEQRSDEWRAARLGRLTASSAGDMLATTKSGYAASRENLRWRLVLERMTGRSQEKDFQSAAMLEGIEREAQAVVAYEAMTGHLVSACGFLQHSTLMAGASLDGYLGDFDVLVSIKCRQPKAHAEHLLSGTIPNDALQQMRHELWLTGAADHHYVSWNPDFPEALQLRVKVIHAADLDLPKFDDEVRKFLAEVDEGVAKLTKAAA